MAYYTGQEPLWSSNGYSQFFGVLLPFVHYDIFPDRIRVTSGWFSQHTQEVPLYRIAAKEIVTNPIGRLFHCGQVKLIVADRKVPDLYLSVKNPESVLALVDQAKSAEQKAFNSAQRRQRIMHNEINRQ